MDNTQLLREARMLLVKSESLLCDPRAGEVANEVAEAIAKWLTYPDVVSAIDLVSSK